MWRIVMIYVRLTVILCVAEGVVLAGTRHAYHDPFAAYRAIMPGQPSNALEYYPCNTYSDDVSTASCVFFLEDGPFSLVSVQYNYSIKRIDFVVRPDGLHLSDLILCWGGLTSIEPHNPPYETGLADVKWGKQNYAVMAANWNSKHLNYYRPIHYVSIGGEWQGCTTRSK